MANRAKFPRLKDIAAKAFSGSAIASTLANRATDHGFSRDAAYRAWHATTERLTARVFLAAAVEMGGRDLTAAQLLELVKGE